MPRPKVTAGVSVTILPQTQAISVKKSCVVFERAFKSVMCRMDSQATQHDIFRFAQTLHEPGLVACLVGLSFPLCGWGGVRMGTDSRVLCFCFLSICLWLFSPSLFLVWLIKFFLKTIMEMD